MASRSGATNGFLGGVDAIYLGVDAASVVAEAKVRVAMDRINIPRSRELGEDGKS
jgi:hypothetical protein